MSTEPLFPVITHIDEVKAAVKDSKEFVFNKVGNFIFSSYKLTKENTFPDPSTMTTKEEITNAKIRREIRGLVFDNQSGNLVSRTLHKFFNINEREETLEKNIKFDKDIYVLEKLDGSMVTPLLDGKKIRFRTKLSYDNEFTKFIEDFVYGETPIEEFDIENSNLLKFCTKWMSDGYTPIFEWCSPEARIVLAIRKIDDGEYVKYPELRKSAESHDVPVVKAWDFNVQNTTDLVKQIKKLENLEGCVMRFNDGRMYKIKSEWYIDIHKCKSFLKFNGLNENHVWGLVFDNKVDDTLSTLNSLEEKKQLQEFNDKVWNIIEERANKIKENVEKDRKNYPTKKEYVTFCKDVDKFEQRVLFHVYDGKDAQTVLIDACRQFISKNATLNAAKKLLDCEDFTWVPFEQK